MANLYIAATAFSFEPNAKTIRELTAKWAQVNGFTASPDDSLVVDGVLQPPGYIVHTSQNPEPDAAAILADVVAFADGSTDPLPFGEAIPLVQDFAALPAEPPNLPADQARVVATRVPPALWVYALGAWHGPLEPTP